MKMRSQNYQLLVEYSLMLKVLNWTEDKVVVSSGRSYFYIGICAT